MNFTRLFRCMSIVALVFVLLTGNKAKAQQIMMQGWYWDYPKTANNYCWADTIANKAKMLKDAGINFVWLPPLARASSGNNSNGYDPKDLYDYGEYGLGPVSFGTRGQLNNVISLFNKFGINAVADLVYNHRDGGRMENNQGVKDYITGYTLAKANNGDNPFPSDRFRLILPVGGSTGNDAGDYYFKIKSVSGHTKFYGKDYKVYLQTNRVGWKSLADLTESEPNGGGDCSQANNQIELGRNLNATTWDYSGCIVDEFKLTLTTSDYLATGDTIFIYLNNTGSGGYSDHTVYSIWSSARSADIAPELQYQTYTDFSSLPSGKGEMHWNNFKPNNDRLTNLGGDWDGMYFFYDYDQFQPNTQLVLNEWTKWNWENVGIRGLRMDAVKHFTPEFVGNMLNYMHAAGYDPPLVVGEWYSTSSSELSGWITNVYNSMNTETKAAVSPKIFDFALRESLRKACDDNTFFDTRDIFGSGSLSGSGLSGYNIVTFINNHDFRDASGFASLIQYDPILAYTYILTNNRAGVPCIFYPDYFGYPNNGTSYYPSAKAPLKNQMDKLINLHQKFILNATGFDALNRAGTPYSANYISSNASKCLIYQIMGGIAGKDVIVAINFDGNPLKVDIGVNMTNLVIGSKFTDMLGKSTYPTAIVSPSNQIYIDLPARSYSVWVKGDANEIIPVKPSDLVISGQTASSITLKWKDNSVNESNFVVERKTGQGGTFSTLSTLAANTITFTDNTVVEGELYYYRLVATNTAGNSDFSNDVSSAKVWTGTENWASLPNWETGTLPKSEENIFVANGELTVNQNISQANLCLAPASKLTIANAKTVDVTGKLILRSDPLGTATLVNNGGLTAANTKVELYLTGANNGTTATGRNWYISSPTSASQSSVFLPGGTPVNRLWHFDPATNAWSEISSTTANLTTGEGFVARLANSGVVGFTAGNLNNGDVPINLTRTSANRGFALIGNPYPSFLDWDAVYNSLGTDKDNIYSTIWYRTKYANYVFETYNATSGLGSDIGTTITKNIAPMQGFWCRLNTGINSQTLMFTNAMRSHQNGKLLKTGQNNKVLRLKVSKGENADVAIIYFNENASNEIEEYDSPKMFADVADIPEIYTKVGNENLAFNGLKSVENTDVVPLSFKTAKAGQFTISANEIVGFDINQPILLEDKLTGKIQDLRLNPSYTFSSEAITSERFNIHFKSVTTDIKETENSGGIKIFTSDQRTIRVILNQQDFDGNVFIYGIEGNLLQQRTISGNSITISPNLPAGTYLVKVQTAQKLITAKIVLIQ
jgi:hypothetical protein